MSCVLGRGLPFLLYHPSNPNNSVILSIICSDSRIFNASAEPTHPAPPKATHAPRAPRCTQTLWDLDRSSPELLQQHSWTHSPVLPQDLGQAELGQGWKQSPVSPCNPAGNPALQSAQRCSPSSEITQTSPHWHTSNKTPPKEKHWRGRKTVGLFSYKAGQKHGSRKIRRDWTFVTYFNSVSAGVWGLYEVF